MGPRPTHLNLNNERSDTTYPPPKMNFQLDLPSPRAGEIPPALSPLDAFALQSRILAKQFEQQARNGKRISRIPHPTVAKEIANRPDYFRSVSGESEMSYMDEVPEVQEEMSPTNGGLAIGGSDEMNRPMSYYPTLGHASKPSDASPAATPYYDAEDTQQEVEPAQDYFGLGAPRASSPEPVDPTLTVEAASPIVPSLSNSMDTVSTSHPRTMTNGSTRSQRSLRSERGLLPPKSPGHPKSPRSMQNIRSVPQDSGDEDNASYNGAYATSTSRKFSGSTTMSRPQSPFSPYAQPLHRSPSMTSEYSMNGSLPPLQQPRAPFNFSRPRSSGGQSIQSVDMRPSFDRKPSYEARTAAAEVPLRKASGASTALSSYRTNPSTRQNSVEDVRSTVSNIHMDTPNLERTESAAGSYFSESEPNPATSYVYTKYSLPRGKAVDRNSVALPDSWVQNQFDWEDKRLPPPLKNNVPAKDIEMFHPRRREDSDLSTFSAPAPVRPASPAGSTGSQRISGMWLRSRAQSPLGRSARSRSANPDSRREKSGLHRSSPSIQTESMDQTMRAVSLLHQRAPSTELTPEEHLELGIQTHSAGELSKSTYHLRLAAKAGLPTGMLLYALACRHGWGMRPNQEEGVMWLRKAIECSGGFEATDIEGTVSSTSRIPTADPVAEAAERKKRKAQFALAIYELGISYMNGWGCQKDKPLALRCYEVAGTLGDCDALAEAGFCYTQGVGTKKDLRKAASLYRKAAEGGMSMAGNSWYVNPTMFAGCVLFFFCVWCGVKLTLCALQDIQSQVYGRHTRCFGYVESKS